MSINAHELSMEEFLLSSWDAKPPDSWTRVKLHYILEEVKNTVPAESTEQLTPSVVHGVVLQSDLEHSPQQALREGYELLSAQPGDFVVSMSSHEYGLEKCEIPGGISPDYTLLRPVTSGKRAQFLEFLFKSRPFIETISLLSSGIRQGKRIYWSELGNVEICLPPAETAEEIASMLRYYISRYDDMISMKEDLIELLDEKRQAKIWDMVTEGKQSNSEFKEIDTAWIQKIPSHWKFGEVGWYFDIQLGKMLDEKQITGENLAPYLRNRDVQWWDINIDDLPKMDFSPADKLKYNLHPGDVLVCEGGEIGRSAIWTHEEFECYYQKALHRVRPHSSDQNPKYFCYFMELAANSGVFTARSNRSTISHLTVEKLEKQKMPIPPIEEQETIVSVLDEELEKIDTLRKKTTSQIQLLKEKRKALISKTVTGQIGAADLEPKEGVETIA